MKIIIKNQVFSIGASSLASDENGKPLFKIKGKVISITKKKYIKNLDNKLLYIVRNKFFHAFSRKALIYNSNKHLVATIKRNNKIKLSFTVEGTKFPIFIEADKFPYAILNIKYNNKIVGQIRRNLTIIADSFTVEILDPKDAPFITSLVIGVDNIMDAYNNKER